jgi:Lrp/AsnC family transcriptional regulator for asnA, asnC and gidA
MKNKLNALDYNILALLCEDAQMPNTEIAKRFDVSAGTVHMRVKKMRDLGVIRGATLKLDYAQMGWKLTAFLGIFLRESILYKEVIDKLYEIPEIVRIHHAMGKYDIFVKIHAKDSTHFRDVYQDKIITINAIKGTESFISVEENLNRHIEFGPDMENHLH